MTAKNKEYAYSGPVMESDMCVDRCWKTSTWAPSEKKARNNLIFRYKRDNNKARCAKITLPGKISLKEGDVDGGL